MEDGLGRLAAKESGNQGGQRTRTRKEMTREKKKEWEKKGRVVVLKTIIGNHKILSATTYVVADIKAYICELTHLFTIIGI